MSQTLFSPAWYKVSNLKVRIRKHADIHRHVYRGKVWYVLQDHVTGQFQRFTPQAYQLIGLMNGERTLQQIWDIACEKLKEDLPTQDEVINLVGQLNKANVVQTNVLPSIKHLHQRHQSEQKKKLLQQLKSPLSVRIPLLDPERFLAATSWIARCLFSKLGALCWLVMVILGVVLATLHWTELTNNLSDQVLGLENLLLMALVYPVIKLAHELGHGWAVKRWGGEVHEMGVMLLIFIPVPYVDASSASSFSNKHQRMIVGAVGVLAELFIAALAMTIWVLVEPGIIRALAYNVMLIGGISTLLFNGNPLLRFDAYYVLADFLEIPNLAARGNAQVGYLVKRYLFRIGAVRTNAYSKSESFWLALYAVASYIYRLFVMVAISLFVASKYFIIGILLAIWSVMSSLIIPILKVIVKPRQDPLMRRKSVKIYLGGGIVITGIALLLFYFPVPYQTYAQGVIYVPQDSYIRAKSSGFVDKVLVSGGRNVNQQDVLIQLHSPALIARESVLKAQVNEAKFRYEASVNNRTESDILLQELKYLVQEYQHVTRQMSNLEIVSPAEGRFVFAQRELEVGRYYNRGEVLGFVVNFDRLPLAAMISEDDIDKVRYQTRAVSIKLASQPKQQYSSAVIRQMPSSTHNLPSSVLTTDGGGLIVLDPNRAAEMKSYKSYFRVELDSSNAPIKRFDERVHVLFEHEPEPVAYRWYRSIRRLLLRQFDV
ncbi:peptidase M50 [Vibrio sp. UCD-FRSSP16_10]|uniref:efflux RND transporter periplasmic adaptor subunit n=1 Tax=unclassified Vibrio TaxID=2614977 RepID=UPI000800A7D5|nr:MULTISPECIES: efflux RND transporter periplasmic adaptor subunit [unclassified Vibrio]OBT08537.1 peptidase M50 [Vibrio sp. UCD-FRSSP16_30]OBT18067.1 peptidase M50 [Vibrio sp. UCD-FRSSP16_10]